MEVTSTLLQVIEFWEPQPNLSGLCKAQATIKEDCKKHALGMHPAGLVLPTKRVDGLLGRLALLLLLPIDPQGGGRNTDEDGKDGVRNAVDNVCVGHSGCLAGLTWVNVALRIN